jgi:hypothetical protein
MRTVLQQLGSAAFVALSIIAAGCSTNIVSDVVNSPLSAAGSVEGAHTGINIYLQTSDAQGMEFMDPMVPGYGIPAGGRIEIEMGSGFERLREVPLSQKAIMLVTGAPQQGLPGKKVGYKVGEGGNGNTFAIEPSSDAGLPVDKAVSPTPGSKMDPIRQRGIKVFHVGFLQSAFVNKSGSGVVHVRIIDGKDKVIHEGKGTLNFIKEAVPQILPSNFADKRRNHNWQRVKSGQILGITPGTVPITLNLYAKATVPAGQMAKFKQGIVGAGVLSTPQLKAMGYAKPAALARYNGGLIVQDTSGDGSLDPRQDRIIGGVIASAPAGAKGQELRSLERGGKLLLSRPAAEFAPKPGKRFGGAIMQLQFTAGSKAGKYRPTLALLRDPSNLNSGDGSRYTYTIVVQ